MLIYFLCQKINITGYFRIRVSGDCTTWFDIDSNLFYHGPTTRRGDSLELDGYNYTYSDNVGFDKKKETLYFYSVSMRKINLFIL